MGFTDSGPAGEDEKSDHAISQVDEFSVFKSFCWRSISHIDHFRWKKRKRKNFSIVVTERVRREMSDQVENELDNLDFSNLFLKEESKNKKRQGGGRPPK